MDFILYNDASDVEVMFDIYGNVQCTRPVLDNTIVASYIVLTPKP
jgi:hypothetical protein